MRRRLLELKNTALRHLVVTGVALLIGAGSAFAQSGTPNPPDQAKQQPGQADANANAAREANQRKVEEFVEAQQAINGPAGNPECVWLGRRVVRLMWNDDLDTAFRHLDLYDRFGCPGGHVQAAFRCLTRFGAQIDDKVRGSLDGRIHACWINPGAQPQPAAAAAPSPA
ncbi:beta-1-3, beta-1-6-glucan biosynthesis protein, partial [Bradyrhizobium sp. UBA2491]|uniref:beta-1-3, beta-1-6-glucan biosynthesis protein n=2 Tax=Nitrobacteraceae TaxID=41294 RepID=UPI0025BBEC8A